MTFSLGSLCEDGLNKAQKFGLLIIMPFSFK